VKRREFITLLGGSAVTWPLAARPFAAIAQRGDRMRRVGVLIGTAETDPETKRRVGALTQGLQDAGWAQGRNIQLEFRFSGADFDRIRRFAREIVDLGPDVIVVHSNDVLAALREVDRTIPAVFAQVGDPVGSGFVVSLSHPGGNLTGFTSFEAEIGSKWVEMLKECVPSVTRALVLHDPQIVSNLAFLKAAQSAAATLGLSVTPGLMGATSDIDQLITRFPGTPGGGLVVLPSPIAAVNRARIITLAAEHKLPSVFPYRFFAESGGMASYGVDTVDLYRRAAEYVDRILKGAKPADLPVQQPTKFEMVINLKTAKTLGFDVPPTFLARADEVIE
jgi:putative ABC transport system substrate-binding protein